MDELVGLRRGAVTGHLWTPLAWLVDGHPDLASRIVNIETTAAPKNRTVEGLWRRATKTRPGSMSEFIASERARRALPIVTDDCTDCGGL